MRGRRPAGAGWLLLPAACLSAGAWAASHQVPIEDREVELETLRTQIRGVQQEISAARGQVDAYRAELKEQEVAIARVTESLDAIERNIAAQVETLEKLRREREEQAALLEEERALLADQVRAAYITGRHDFLKLILNQEDPELAGRMMAYHDYYNRARVRRISEVQVSIRNLARLEDSIGVETAKLESLRARQLQRLEELDVHRRNRTAVIGELEALISSRDQDLKTLLRDEEELAGLLDELKNRQSIVRQFEELPPFDSLKGQLKWPVRGDIVSRFGSLRKDGKLRWNGVRIAARAGQEVTAVSAGKVVFADWFRNLGLLIILDHGGGYMSLYGHNERLLKKEGDLVGRGEVIGRVGNTGGQAESALYFEIRRQGDPQNPDLWCRA